MVDETKISDFATVDILNDADLITIVSNGGNFNITAATLKAALRYQQEGGDLSDLEDNRVTKVLAGLLVESGIKDTGTPGGGLVEIYRQLKVGTDGLDIGSTGVFAGGENLVNSSGDTNRLETSCVVDATGTDKPKWYKLGASASDPHQPSFPDTKSSVSHSWPFDFSGSNVAYLLDALYLKSNKTTTGIRLRISRGGVPSGNNIVWQFPTDFAWAEGAGFSVSSASESLLNLGSPGVLLLSDETYWITIDVPASSGTDINLLGVNGSPFLPYERRSQQTGSVEDLVTSSDIASFGDVFGPASAVDSNFALFDTTTGKLIKDSSENIGTVRGKAVKIVNSVSDLPAPSGGFHTLNANTTYRVSGTLNLTNDIIFSSGSSINGVSPITDKIITSSTGTIFNSVDNDVAVGNLTIILNGTGSKLYDFTDSTGTKFCSFQQCLIYALSTGISMGDASGGASVTVGSSLFFGFDNPFVFDGVMSRISYERSIFNSCDDIFLLSATLTLNTGDINNCTFTTDDAGDKILTDSGATIINQISVTGCSKEGPGTFDTGAELNPDYILRGNTGFKDTQLVAQGGIIGSVANTVFAGLGTVNAVAVNYGGVFVASDQKQFTVSTSGLVTYIGKEERQFYFDVTNFATIAGGSSRDYGYFWVKNGATQILSSTTQAQYNGSSPGSSSCKTIIELNTGDTMQLFAYQISGSLIDLNVISSSISAVSV